jgi:hypothetical protein
MPVINAPRTEPFCDYLNVTCNPEDSFITNLSCLLDVASCPVSFKDHEKTIVSVGTGKIVLLQKTKFHSASASGSALSYLRNIGAFEDYLSVLSEVPHKVTRLDVAVDVALDAPLMLRKLEKTYPDDRVSFTRKALKVTRLYSARDSDGQQSGSWYAGNYGKARLTAKVYDKQLEAFEKRGEILPPTTRIELTFAKDFGCSLRDAFMPASLFYTHSLPVLKANRNYDAWVPHGVGWAGTPPDTKLDWEIYKRRLDNSPEIASLVELAAKLGPNGKTLLMRDFEKHLDNALRDYSYEASSLGSDIKS